MGNRAIITTRDNYNTNKIGVYLHWNGGRDSVEAFLKYCKLKGYRPPEQDCYGWARLCQVIGNFFGGTLSVGIDNFDQDEGQWADNGTYIIENWEIVDRKHFNYIEQNNWELEEMLLSIDKAQPKAEQLGKAYISAKEIPTEELKIGDIVFMQNFESVPKAYTVVGFGADEYVNGTSVKDVPYVNMFGSEEKGYSWNCNNYIRTPTVKGKKVKSKC